jgi:hypothetical protein
VEAAIQLILPLLGQVAGADDQAALQVAANGKLLDEETRHDGFAGPWVIGEQKAERLTGKHLAIDSRDLVWQGLNLRRVDCQQWIEEVRQADALSLGDQPEEGAIAVEAPWVAGGHDLKRRLAVAVEKGRLPALQQRLPKTPLFFALNGKGLQKLSVKVQYDRNSWFSG